MFEPDLSKVPKYKLHYSTTASLYLLTFLLSLHGILNKKSVAKLTVKVGPHSCMALLLITFIWFGIDSSSMHKYIPSNLFSSCSISGTPRNVSPCFCL